MVTLFCVKLKKKKKSKETNTQTNKQKNRETNQQNHSSSKLKRTSFLTAFMGPQKVEEKSMWALDPPDYITWHLCVLIQSDQKRPSSWYNHCFLPHKEQNLQVGGEIYFCTKVILSLACVLAFVLWAVVYGEAYSTRQEAIQIYGERSRAFGTLVTVAFSLPFSARHCRTGTSFLLLLPIFFKRRFEFLSFVLCGLFSDVLSWTRKKKRLIKKPCELRCLLCCVDTDEQLAAAKRTKTDFIN